MNASARFWPEPISQGDDRTPFQEDRDKILYSSAFKRLLSVTQVASASVGYVFHTRLTHSLQVAQVGRRLAEKLLKKFPDECLALGGYDPDAVETACLAHDIGHPPFGHLGEEGLNSLAEEFGGFEGNAQSFRIVTHIAVRTTNQRGLNLTSGSLWGILKYPWLYSDRPDDPRSNTGRKEKWGAYDCDREMFEWVRQSRPDIPPKARAVEAEIMDWADDVTYSVHDVEDFFRAGLIPLHLLKRSSRERERFFNFILENDRKDAALKSLPSNEIEKIFDDLLIFAFAFDDPYEGSREDHAKLRTFSSRLIGRFINALELDPARLVADRPVKRQERAEQEVAILKQLTWFYVIEAPSLAIQKLAQKKVIDRLGSIFLEEAVSEKPSGVFPVFFRNQLREPGLTSDDRLRTAIDLLSNMTERQAIEMYQRLEGISVASGFDKIVG